MSRDPRAFAQELRADAAVLEGLARDLRARADMEEGAVDCATAREAERAQAIRDSHTGRYVGLLRGPSENP